MNSTIIGVDLAGLLGGTHGERRRWVGVEWGGIWGGVSPLQPTKGSGGASWAPPAGSGAEPRPKTDFGVFWRPQNAHFVPIWHNLGGGTICISVPPAPNSGGDVSPLSPPWSTPMSTTSLNGPVLITLTLSLPALFPKFW